MDCPHIPEIVYRDFSQSFHKRAVASNIPVAGEIELTRHCNLKCAHCYCPRDSNKKEMTFKEICRILDEIVDSGCFWLLFTGGEPLIRPDFLNIYTYAKKKGFIISLFTNGTLITPEIADYLREWPPFLVEISLYGATQTTYEKITGVVGSHKKCLAGIEMLIERKVPLKLKTMAMTLNKHELSLMKMYAQERNLNFVLDPLITPRLDGSQQPCQLRIPPKEAMELDLSDTKRCEEWKKVYQKLWGAPARTDMLYPCSLAMWSFHITAFGDLQACLMAQEPTFDLLKNKFSKCWPELIRKFQALKSNENNKCNTCELIASCGRCPAWAQLENGYPNTEISYTCQIAHLRLDAFQKRGFFQKGDLKNGEHKKETLQKARNI